LNKKWEEKKLRLYSILEQIQVSTSLSFDRVFLIFDKYLRIVEAGFYKQLLWLRHCIFENSGE